MSSGRYLFVSDLHLDADTPDAVAQFLDFLRGDARDSRALYILGDLFETWIGDDDTEPVRERICAALREFTARGVPCFVLRGNRDFLLGAGFERRTGCQLLPDPVLLQLGSVPVFVSHGDVLCTADHAYQRFRSLVRAPEMQRMYLQLSLGTRRALANAARRGSRQHIRDNPADIMDVHPDAVTEALRVSGSHLIIHGHTHRPAVHAVPYGDHLATRIVLGDWYEQGSCLVLHEDGRHELLALPRRAAAPSTVSTASSNCRV
jgi:UDP-2,3-diacylglucosamine hydrolase